MRDALGRMQRVLVLGGGSEIAGAIVLRLLAEGPLDVVLAARDPEALETAALARGGATIERRRFDALACDEHAALVASVFDAADVDCVVAAFGLLGDQARAETDPAAAVEVAATNYVGAVSVLTSVAERLRLQRHGALVVLSSVAAERARRSNYVYGSSKAGLDAFAQGLQLRLAGSGARVLLVRPGFVRTAMTSGLKPAPFAVGPEQVAAAVVAALHDGRDTIRVPRSLDAVMLVIRSLPKRLLQRL
ncbi:MAG: SDR family NAD(P)-dependent oxidoreductase [Gaiellaceae bacterium]